MVVLTHVDTGDAATRFRKALAFDISPVLKRYIKEQNVSEETAKEHEQELKKFLVLCSLQVDRSFGISETIDQLWHTFIVFTRAYSEFCREVCGRFIHHSPAENNRSIPVEEKQAMYRGTLDAYRVHFGEPPTHLWPTVESRSKEFVVMSGTSSYTPPCCDTHSKGD